MPDNTAAMPDQAAAPAPAESAPAKPIGPGDHLFLVDGSSFVYRAYYQSMNQDAKYNYRSDGLPTGAVRLFSTKLYQFILEGAVGIRPTHMAIIFDKAEATFRNAIYPEYKANRKAAPDDLVPQFPLMREAVKAFGLTPIEQSGYEADDLIATYARQAEAAGADVLIISADKDLMQVVTPKVLFYDFESGARGRPGYRPERKIDVAGVIEHFGVPPEKVVDIQALVGDTSDNVPGVPGIGVKTAAQLLAEYGDLDTLLARAGEIKQPKRRENILAFAEQAKVSRQLVQLDGAVAVETPLDAFALPKFDPRRLMTFSKAMELFTLTKRVAEASGIDPALVDADPRLRAAGGAGTAAGLGQVGSMVNGWTRGVVAMPPPDSGEPDADDEPVAPELPEGVDTSLAPRPAAWAGGDLFGLPAPPPATGDEPPFYRPVEAATQAVANAVSRIDRGAYETITGMDRLTAFIAAAERAGQVALAVIGSAADPMRGEICGIAFAIAPGQSAYIPLGHRSRADDLLGEGLAAGQIPAAEALARLRPLLEDPGVLKIGHDVKAAMTLLARQGIALHPADDIMLMSYALDAGRGGSDFVALAERWLGHQPTALKELVGSGRNAITFDLVPVEAATPYAAELPDLAMRLWAVLRPRLAADRVTTVYQTLERPLVPVLAAMERHGIAIDRQILSRQSHDFAQKLARLEAEIAEVAGGPFNVGSPKQLGDILFGKLQLPGGRKTKTGAWSTDADVLEELAAEGHPLPRLILDWRQISKLKSTYTDALPGYINPDTNRVHTSFALASTSTGRLSSLEPNLQNIPVRTEEGRQIRTAFVPEPGNLLVSADYSQIELRVLAHVADIPQLRQAFADGLDIHAMTASEMFNTPIEGMDPLVRRRAKAINFGIIYGISAFGLANQLGIPRSEAKDYIDRYFLRFPGIRGYMEATKAYCREHGYVQTIFGRKAHYPSIGSRNVAERSFNERAAINAPIQGSAADIIRRAMIRMPAALSAAGLSARMLLQVHDELVFEVPEAEVERTIPVIREIMEQAPEPAVRLAVPLHVDARAGGNWEAAH